MVPKCDIFTWRLEQKLFIFIFGAEAPFCLLKVHKREKFFGSDFEFFTIL
jgi:hypothetical protein